MDRFGVRPERIPCANAAGDPIGSGCFAERQEMALRSADWAGLPRRRAGAARRGGRRGIGLGHLVKASNAAPCPNHDPGVKGAGEAGTCGAPPAFASAVRDAPGVLRIDGPPTPERVWRALSAAPRRASA